MFRAKHKTLLISALVTGMAIIAIGSFGPSRAYAGSNNTGLTPDCSPGTSSSANGPVANCINNPNNNPNSDSTLTCSGQSGTNGTCTTKAPIPNCTTSKCDLVGKYLDPAITLLTILVGIVVVINIILGGIQYSTSAGDPQKAAKAKSRITNAIIAVVAFALLYGFLQIIIPGGVFSKPNSSTSSSTGNKSSGK